MELGSQVVSAYLEAAGLQEDLDAIGAVDLQLAGVFLKLSLLALLFSFVLPLAAAVFAAMAAVGSLAAGVAHEVNNPLGGILNCIENMREHPDDGEMRERYLQLIHDGLKRIEHIVANLLDFSRQRRTVLEPTSLNHSLRHVIDLVKFQLGRNQVEVEMNLDPEALYLNIRKDKKRSGDQVHLVLLDGPGSTVIKPFELNELKRIVHDLC